jgi:serine/threonine protein kinase
MISWSGVQSPAHCGRFEIIGPLATGGMADLFLARAGGIDGFELLAAVKRMRAHLAANPEFVRLFLDETRLAAQLRHPNLVQVYDAGHDGGSYFFAMEYVHGRDLRALLIAAARRGRVISLAEALTIVLGVCAGLHHAHECLNAEGKPIGVVHRDISPANVLVSYDGAVKLADFGIAKATAHARETSSGTLRGKIKYMSPEQCSGEPLDRRSDLYSLCVVLFELTTGSRPHPDQDTELTLLRVIADEPPRQASSVRPGYPLELEQIVMRGLERNPDQRYANAQELQIELEHFARAHKLAVSPLTLKSLMSEVFPDDVDVWTRANRAGVRLADHLTTTLTLSPAADADGQGTAPELEPLPERSVSTTASRSRRRGALALAGAACVAGVFLVAQAARTPHVKQPIATAPVPAPAPRTTKAQELPSPPVEGTPEKHDLPPVVLSVTHAKTTHAKSARPPRDTKRKTTPATRGAFDPEAPLLPR